MRPRQGEPPERPWGSQDPRFHGTFLRAGHSGAKILNVETMLHREPTTVHGISDRHIRKDVRIRTLGPLFAQRRIFFNPQSAGARELVNQLRDFPIGDHDDGPDALEMAYYLAAHVGVTLPTMPSRLPLATC